MNAARALAARTLVSAALLAAPAFGGELRVRVAVEPAVLALGEAGRLVVEVEGTGLDGPRVAPRFELDNLEIAGGASFGQQVSLGTGGSRWQQRWTWPVRGLEVGPAGVREVTLAGVSPAPTAAPVEIEIVAERPHAPPPRRSPTLDEVEKLLGRAFPDPFYDRPRRPEGGPGPRVFLRTTIDDPRLFVGQRVRLTTWIYTQAPIHRLEKVEVPSFESLWSENLDVDPVAEQESVEWQGEVWRRAPVDRRVIAPLKSGTLFVEPVRVQVLTQQVERDPIFYRPVFVPRELLLASEPLRLEVEALPPPPPDLGVPFSGAVGRLELSARLVPNRLEVGHGASLTVTATGPGAFEGLAAPAVAPEAPGFRVTPAPAAGASARDKGRSWSFVVVPGAAGRQRLPPLEMAYFDPALESYQVARTELPELEVRPATPAAVAGSPAPAATAAAPGGTLARAWPWAVAPPVLVGLAVLLFRRRRGPSGLLPPAVAREFAAALERACAEERPRRAAREIEEAWQSLLAAVPGGPVGAPPAEWPAELARRGARRELVAEVERLVGDLTYLRHAPELATTGELVAEITRRSQRIARDFAFAR